MRRRATPAQLTAKFASPFPSLKQYKRINVKQVDAFTDIPLMGNAAGVVLNAQGLTDQQMKLIAREMAVSETAFVLPAAHPGSDMRIRTFSSEMEVTPSGHAIVASFHVMGVDGLYGMNNPGHYRISLETRSGLVPVRVEKGLSRLEIFFGLPVPEFSRAGQFKLDVMRIMNITLEEFDVRLPMVMTNCLFVPVRRLHTIFALKPNFFALAQLLTNRKLDGLCVFTTETIERHSAVHSRFFAPATGINEDPVTGSANGPLGVYLFEQGLLEGKIVDDAISITGEQGDVIGRKGRVGIHMNIQGNTVKSLMVGGQAITTLDGEMILP